MAEDGEDWNRLKRFWKLYSIFSNYTNSGVAPVIIFFIIIWYKTGKFIERTFGFGEMMGEMCLVQEILKRSRVYRKTWSSFVTASFEYVAFLKCFPHFPHFAR